MQVVYSDQKLPQEVAGSIFLAGPTPRAMGVESWRPRALELLRSSEFGKYGTVFVPETSDGEFKTSYTDQVKWEQQAISRADCVLFWVPRRLNQAAFSMPGLTTNVEFGECLHRANIVLGYPGFAEKMRYLKWQASRHNIQVKNSLEETIGAAVSMAGQPVLRKAGEVTVPNYIWNTPQFQNWYSELKKAGNQLLDFETKWVFRVGPGIVFAFAGQVKIYVTSEKRIKSNEFILSRPDIGAAVLHSRNDNDIEVVMVKEFRSPVRNDTGMVLELPSGSSLKNLNMYDVAVQELEEETGLVIDAERFNHHPARQLAATWSTHKGWVVSAKLSPEEMNSIKDKEGQLIIGKSSTECTYLTVRKVQDLLSDSNVDYATLGMVWKGIHNG